MKIKEKYIKNGFYLAKGLFNKTEIIKIRKEIKKIFNLYYYKSKDKDIIELFKKDFDGFHGCAQACQNLISISRLSNDERLIKLLKKIGLIFPSINTRPLVSFSSKKTAKSDNNWKVPAHQDWPSVQGSLNGVTCWIPLVKINEKLGPLEICPKSHKRGYLHHENSGVPVLCDKDTENESFLPIKMNLGDVLVFNAFTIHRSGMNKTNDKIRLSMHFRYNDLSEETFIKRKYPRQRIDKYKEEVLYPGFPTSAEMNEFLRLQKYRK